MASVTELGLVDVHDPLVLLYGFHMLEFHLLEQFFPFGIRLFSIILLQSNALSLYFLLIKMLPQKIPIQFQVRHIPLYNSYSFVEWHPRQFY